MTEFKRFYPGKTVLEMWGYVTLTPVTPRLAFEKEFSETSSKKSQDNIASVITEKLDELTGKAMTDVATVGVSLAPSIRGDRGRVHQVSADNLFSPDGGQASEVAMDFFNIAIAAAKQRPFPAAVQAFTDLWSEANLYFNEAAALKLSKSRTQGVKKRPAVFCLLSPGMSYIVRGQFWSDDTFQQKSKALKIIVKRSKIWDNLAPLGTWGKK